MSISHQYDICLQETFLDSWIEISSNKIDIEDYDTIRAYVPGNKKGGLYVL